MEQTLKGGMLVNVRKPQKYRENGSFGRVCVYSTRRLVKGAWIASTEILSRMVIAKNSFKSCGIKQRIHCEKEVGVDNTLHFHTSLSL